MKSIFSKIIDREIPAEIVAENEQIIVIKDINPKAPIHLLIIPKKEIRDIQSFGPEDFGLAAAIFQMAQELSRTVPGAEEFRLQVNSGHKAGQRVFHVHAHFLAGAEMCD
ncbi:TPA: histidine triad nucleotide-binding protein [Candidatus Dependentiae bacterium]|nr:histidine triad nucleotide-binding protein [Candidatus Dependentiae bacterium]